MGPGGGSLQAVCREHRTSEVSPMIEPLRMSFVVACRPDHAFDTWTTRASSWWPPDHTASGEAGAQIVLEPRVGGRIFERTPGGRELEWGEITEWDRPRRLRY